MITPAVVTATMLKPPPRGVGVLCELRGFGLSTRPLMRECRSSHAVAAYEASKAAIKIPPRIIYRAQCPLAPGVLRTPSLRLITM
jgi:hypothetical protein